MGPGQDGGRRLGIRRQVTDERPGPEIEDKGSGQPEGEKKRTTRFLAGRMWGAVTLKADVIRDTSDDRFATFQSLQVVLLASLSAAMSGVLPGEDPRFGLVAAIVGWLVWVYVAHLASTRVLGADAQSVKSNRLMRSGGMAMTPAILLLFWPVPFVGWLILALGVIWMLVAMTGALRFTYEHGDWSRAIQASAVGLVVASAVYAAIVLAFG